MLPLLLTPGLTPMTLDPEPDPGSPSFERWIAFSSEVAPSGWVLRERKRYKNLNLGGNSCADAALFD